MIHAIDLRRIQKTLHVFAQTEDRRAAFGRITPDAFKNAGAVMQNVRHHVHARVVPFDELAVMPDHVTNARSAHVFSLSLL